MPKKKTHYPEKPWHPDPVRWREFIERADSDPAILRARDEPKGGWQLWRLDTLEDVDQQEKPTRCSTS